MAEPRTSTAVRTTSQILRGLGISAPTLLLDEVRVRRNIARMAQRASAAGVRLRPHAKTHQSAEIARWLAEAGARGITVSSLPMARYFAEHGWRDITLARLVHPGEGAELAAVARWIEAEGRRGAGGREGSGAGHAGGDRSAGGTSGTSSAGGTSGTSGTSSEMPTEPALGVPVDDPAVPGALARELDDVCLRFWIKVDTGYGRTGVRWDDDERLAAVARAVQAAGAGPLAGVLAHTGQAYGVAGADRLAALYETTTRRLRQAAAAAAAGRRPPPAARM